MSAGRIPLKNATMTTAYCKARMNPLGETSTKARGGINVKRVTTILPFVVPLILKPSLKKLARLKETPKKEVKMAKQEVKREGRVLHFLAWFTGVIVSLVVGQAMIQGLLLLPTWLGGTSSVGVAVAWFVGWVIVLTTLIGAVMALLRK